MANEKREPHKHMTDKDNDLSSAQEVTYANDFKRADKAHHHEKKKNEK